MFSRRGRNQTSRDLLEQARVEGKGRATPKRRDAERERLERVKPRDRKAAGRVERERRLTERKARSEGMMRGDERYLPPRDAGPRRRFIRDFVDGRFTASELFLPMAVVILLLGLFGSHQAENASVAIWMLLVIFIIVDSMIWTTLLRKALRKRFPDAARKRGDVAYAMMRAMLSRPLRTPKPQVKRGTRPA